MHKVNAYSERSKAYNLQGVLGTNQISMHYICVCCPLVITLLHDLLQKSVVY